MFQDRFNPPVLGSARPRRQKGRPAFEDKHVFTEHYGAIVVTAYTLLMAMVIFLMTIPMSVRILLLVISAATFALIMRPAKPPDPPMGTSSDLEGVRRPRPVLDSPNRHTH